MLRNKISSTTASSSVACCCAVSSQLTTAARFTSVGSTELSWKKYFSKERPSASSYPDGAMTHPHPGIQNKLRKTTYEWRNHFGHGQKIGHLGPMRDLPDWEHSDGTPAPHNSNGFNYLSHKQDMLAQIIRAGAIVERLAKADQLPRIPGSDAQRDWDPEIPLFLEDDDERGGSPAPEWFVASRKFSTIPKNGFAKAARTHPDAPSEAGRKDEGAEELAPLEPLSDYEPTSFISEPLPLLHDNQKRPTWNRRLWSLTDQFLVEKPLRNKNTIGSD